MPKKAAGMQCLQATAAHVRPGLSKISFEVCRIDAVSLGRVRQRSSRFYVEQLANAKLSCLMKMMNFGKVREGNSEATILHSGKIGLSKDKFAHVVHESSYIQIRNQAICIVKPTECNII